MTNKEKKAQELLDSLNMKKNIENMIKSMYSMLTKSMLDTDIGLVLKEEKTLEEYVEKLVKVFDIDAMIYLLIPTYSKIYDTEEEFDIAIEFCRSAIGQKLYDITTGSMKEANAIMELYVANHQEELQTECETLHEEFFEV